MAYEVDPPAIVDLVADRPSRPRAGRPAVGDAELRADVERLIVEHDELRRRAEGAELQVADLQRCLEDAAAVADDAELRAAKLAGALASARAEVADLERRVAELTASRGLATPAAAGAPAGPALPAPVAAADLERTLGRALKRVLADEQNDLLDRACRSRQLPALGDLLPDAAARRRALAAAAGRLGPERSAELASLLGDALDERLAAVLAPATDGDAVAEAARAVYREWRERRVGAALVVVLGEPRVDDGSSAGR